MVKYVNIFVFVAICVATCGVLFGCDSTASDTDQIASIKYSQVILKLGDVYDLTTNTLSNVDLDTVTYTCDELEIVESRLVASKLGNHTVVVNYVCNDESHILSFKVQVVGYNAYVDFVRDNRVVNNISVLEGYNIDVGLKYTDGCDVTVVGNDNVSYIEGRAVGVSAGEGCLTAILSRNNVEVARTELIVNVLPVVDELSVDIVDSNEVVVDTCYKSSANDHIGMLLRLNDFAGDIERLNVTGAEVVQLTDSEDNYYISDGDTYIAVRVFGNGSKSVVVSYNNTDGTNIRTVSDSADITIYDYVDDIAIDVGDASMTDGKYIIYLSGSTIAEAEDAGFDCHIDITAYPTNSNTHATFDFATSGTIVYSNGVITGTSVGEGTLTITSSDDRHCVKTMTVDVRAIPLDSANVVTDSDTYYVVIGESIEIPVSVVINTTYATDKSYTLEASKGSIDSGVLGISDDGDVVISAIFTAGTFSKTINIVYLPSDIDIEYVTTYGDLIVLSVSIFYLEQESYDLTDFIVYGKLDENWVEVEYNQNTNSLRITDQGYTVIKIVSKYNNDVFGLIEL